MIATTGSAASAESAISSTAPTKAPMTPGMPIYRIIEQPTLPNRQCESPDASVVPTSAKCTLVEASAGATPTISNKVVDVTPNAIPSESSTSCAMTPAISSKTKLCRSIPLGRLIVYRLSKQDKLY